MPVRSMAGSAVTNVMSADMFPSYHGVLAVKGCAPLVLAAVAVFDPVTACAAPCWGRFQAIPPEQPEHDHVAAFSVSRFFAAGA